MEQTLQSRRRLSLEAPDFTLRQLFAFAQLVRHAQHRRRHLSNLHEQLAPLRGAALHVHLERLHRRTILVADDHLTVRAITRGLVESLGHSVIVSDGDFNGVPRTTRADAVLLDVPLWSESQVNRVRQARRFSPCIIVATPLPEGAPRARLRAAGASAFLEKPFHPLAIERTIRECVGQAFQPD